MGRAYPDTAPPDPPAKPVTISVQEN
jgi:hypothetical protein